MSMFRSKAIRKVHPDATTINADKEARDEEWNLIELNWTKIEEEEQKLLTDYNSKKYQRDRADAYPSWQTQMDLLYHGGIDALKAELKKTKDKFPKPT